MQIPLEAGDRVVASFPFRDFVLVITELGSVFRIEVGGEPWETKLMLVERW